MVARRREVARPAQPAMFARNDMFDVQRHNRRMSFREPTVLTAVPRTAEYPSPEFRVHQDLSVLARAMRAFDCSTLTR
jgi:hypothetical protein